MEFLEAIIKKHGNWSEETFPKGTSLGALTHLKKEIGEVEELILKRDITSQGHSERLIEEYADCFACLMDSLRREGFTISDLTHAFYNKLAINMNRQWVDNGDGSYRHVK